MIKCCGAAFAIVFQLSFTSNVFAVKPPFWLEEGMVLHYSMDGNAYCSIRLVELDEQIKFKVMSGSKGGCMITLDANTMNTSSGFSTDLPCVDGIKTDWRGNTTLFFLSRKVFEKLEGAGKSDLHNGGGKNMKHVTWTNEGKAFHEARNLGNHKAIPIPCLKLKNPDGQVMLVYENNRIPLIVSFGNVRLTAMEHPSFLKWGK